MANCMTCKHNNKRTRMCSVQDAHTDLGYVLNCVYWEPTDDAKIKELKTENARLRNLVSELHSLATDENVYVLLGVADAWNDQMDAVENEMRKLGMEVEVI